jgi:hypothetical protein
MGTKMKMSEHDRIMAISRCAGYEKDFREFLKVWATSREKAEALSRNLCRKWRLEVPIPPRLGKDEENFFEANRREAFVELAENKWPTNALLVKYQAYIGEYQFVRWRIDLTKNEKELLQAFTKKIRSWKRHIPKQRKTRKTTHDPWEIYDLHKKKGLSLLEIARRKTGKSYTGKENNPAYNEELEASDKRVRRAYKQAEKMIQAVSAEFKSWYRKNLP